MQAMVLNKIGAPLEWTELADREPARSRFASRSAPAASAAPTCMSSTASCRIRRYQSFRASRSSAGSTPSVRHRDLQIGQRLGIRWLRHTCGVCPYCVMQRENLCDRPLFTGYRRDGGFATATVADARFAFPPGEAGKDESIAPLLCAGLISWRSLEIAGDGNAVSLRLRCRRQANEALGDSRASRFEGAAVLVP